MNPENLLIMAQAVAKYGEVGKGAKSQQAMFQAWITEKATEANRRALFEEIAYSKLDYETRSKIAGAENVRSEVVEKSVNGRLTGEANVRIFINDSNTPFKEIPVNMSGMTAQ